MTAHCTTSSKAIRHDDLEGDGGFGASTASRSPARNALLYEMFSPANMR